MGMGSGGMMMQGKEFLVELEHLGNKELLLIVHDNGIA
jgi:hypothetical protein